MNIVFERIQSPVHPCFDELLALYIDSFPPEERRASSALIETMKVPEMYFTAVKIVSKVVGFVEYWKFESFLYIEHLAVFEAQRRKGIGEGILKRLKKECAPILLEVEIPYDENSTKRVAFYNRSGFSALPVNYYQPPYRIGESVIPMMLFSDRTDWEPETLRSAIELFQFRVYGANVT